MSGFDIIGPDRATQLPALPDTVGGELEVRSGSEGKAGAFLDELNDALSGIQVLSDDVKDKANALARGEPVELHDLMISMGKSDVAFNLMLEVRNKLLDAWQALSRAV